MSEKKQEKVEVWEMNKSIDRSWYGKMRIGAFEVESGKALVLRKLIKKIGENNLNTTPMFTGISRNHKNTCQHCTIHKFIWKHTEFSGTGNW